MCVFLPSYLCICCVCVCVRDVCIDRHRHVVSLVSAVCHVSHPEAERWLVLALTDTWSEGSLLPAASSLAQQPCYAPSNPSTPLSPSSAGAGGVGRGDHSHSLWWFMTTPEASLRRLRVCAHLCEIVGGRKPSWKESVLYMFERERN